MHFLRQIPVIYLYTIKNLLTKNTIKTSSTKVAISTVSTLLSVFFSSHWKFYDNHQSCVDLIAMSAKENVLEQVFYL